MRVKAPIQFHLEMPLFTKARPRLGKDRKTGRPVVHMSAPYQKKQSQMRMLLRKQWTGELLEGPMRLYLEVGGEGRGDLDNIAGAFMDAATGILWADDRCATISELSIQWEKRPKAESFWDIMILPPRQQSFDPLF